jgi:hypothetical protein
VSHRCLTRQFLFKQRTQKSHITVRTVQGEDRITGHIQTPKGLGRKCGLSLGGDVWAETHHYGRTGMGWRAPTVCHNKQLKTTPTCMGDGAGVRTWVLEQTSKRGRGKKQGVGLGAVGLFEGK